jgi:hypothetical protein
MDGLPDLSGLPGWAQALAYAAFALSVGVTIGVGRFGWLRGRRTRPEERADAAPVAAVIVDSSVLKSAASAVEALNVTLGRTNDLIGQFIADEQEARQERDIEEEVARRVDKQLTERRRRQRRVSRKPVG